MHRRGVVVRASRDARLRVSSGITTSFAVARSTVSNGSMNLRHVDDFDADDSVSDADEANGLPGF